MFSTCLLTQAAVDFSFYGLLMQLKKNNNRECTEKANPDLNSEKDQSTENSFEFDGVVHTFQALLTCCALFAPCLWLTFFVLQKNTF